MSRSVCTSNSRLFAQNREINMADAMRDFIAEGVRALERDVAEAA